MLITRFSSLVASPPVSKRTIPREHGIQVDVVVASHADPGMETDGRFSFRRPTPPAPTPRKEGLSLAGQCRCATVYLELFIWQLRRAGLPGPANGGGNSP
jgi:hypothetical protein